MLNFYWNAILIHIDTELGKNIPQFDSEAKENSFSLIQEQDQIRNLNRFELICAEDGLAHLSVDLETGKFQIREGFFHPYNALSRYEEIHYRIIFYRRKRQTLGTGMQPIGDPFIYRFLIGWQCTLKGLNYQRIMFYDPSSGSIEIKAKR